MFSWRSRESAAVSRRKNSRSVAGGSLPLTILTATRAAELRRSTARRTIDPVPTPISSGERVPVGEHLRRKRVHESGRFAAGRISMTNTHGTPP
jgi:hypothetical protein